MFSGTQFMVESEPAFDSITGLSPTVAVEQRLIRQSNPRSTVGTRIKIGTMLAALFAGFGVCDPAYDDGIPLDVSCFQKNSAKGMCVKCLGKGTAACIDEEGLFADKNQHIYEVACELGKRGSTRHMLEEFCNAHGINLWEARFCDLTEEELTLLKYGEGGKTRDRQRLRFPAGRASGSNWRRSWQKEKMQKEQDTMEMVGMQML